MPQIMKKKLTEIQQARTIYCQDIVRFWKTYYGKKTLTGKHVFKVVYKWNITKLVITHPTYKKRAAIGPIV